MTEDKEERRYLALRGTIERSGKRVDEFNDAELGTFFGANPAQIKRLRARPELLENFKRTITKWLSLEDLEILDIVLAALAAEKVGGDPVWLFLIAPPGGSKTELLRSFSNSDHFHHLSDMTSKTLVSGLMISEDLE